MMIDGVSLIGEKPDSPLISQLARGLGHRSIETSVNEQDHLFEDDGVELGFKKSNDGLRLEAIFVKYNNGCPHDLKVGPILFSPGSPVPLEELKVAFGDPVSRGGDNIGMSGYAPTWVNFEVDDRVIVNIAHVDGVPEMITVFCRKHQA